MLAMGSICQEKFACAIRFEMKHLERSYSTLCCSISDILSFAPHPPASQAFVALQSIMPAIGSVGQEWFACAMRNENEAIGEKLFNFMLFDFQYFFLCHPIPNQSVVDLRFSYF